MTTTNNLLQRVSRKRWRAKLRKSPGRDSDFAGQLHKHGITFSILFYSIRECLQLKPASSQTRLDLDSLVCRLGNRSPVHNAFAPWKRPEVILVCRSTMASAPHHLISIGKRRSSLWNLRGGWIAVWTLTTYGSEF